MVRYVLPYTGKNQTRRAQALLLRVRSVFINLARGKKS
jgi:hypothetical protein